MPKMTDEEMKELREKQKAWRKGQLLESKNEYGISDPTPKIAVNNIVRTLVMRASE